MQIGTKMFTLELADKPGTQEYGLMQRDSMPADHGMLIFPDEEDRSFWMKNTRIPLDIIYVNSTSQVVSVKQMNVSDHLAPLALRTAFPSSLVGRYSHDYYEASVAIGLAPLRRSHVRPRCT